MRPRLSVWLLRAFVLLAAAVVLLVAVGWALMSQPQFGVPLAGARLQRATANPQYRDGRFVNLEPETPTGLAILGPVNTIRGDHQPRARS